MKYSKPVLTKPGFFFTSMVKRSNTGLRVQALHSDSARAARLSCLTTQCPRPLRDCALLHGAGATPHLLIRYYIKAYCADTITGNTEFNVEHDHNVFSTRNAIKYPTQTDEQCALTEKLRDCYCHNSRSWNKLVDCCVKDSCCIQIVCCTEVVYLNMHTLPCCQAGW